MRRRAGAPSPPPPRLVDEADIGHTKARIIDATFQRLATQGYAALSIREIAKEAGVNSALINYHFGTKDQLVIEVLDSANRRLLARQAAMYAQPVSAGQKWAQAVSFYDDDLASGFVRVQIELLTASLAHPALRAKLASRLVAWRALIETAVREAFDAFEARGGRLPPFITPEVLGTWIGHFWIGLELIDLVDSPGERKRGREALHAMQQLIEALDARAGRRAGPGAAGRENKDEPAPVSGKLPQRRRRPARSRAPAR
ncbi:MAG: TetR/AcrR family transcriptional regulator [Rubrivivax sp.]|nr:TetR/AcrR family transcriptional regulator [Rubrivivax sp.]